MTKLEFNLGKLRIDAPAYGSQGNAVLGIRDSGKTYTATEIAEKLFEAGIPFTTFDPTGVWRFLRVPGAGRGYPVVVAGGKDGDLPLTVAGAPEIVRAAMKNGVSIVLDLTDQNLSKADWKRIVKSCVRVMLSENAQHGLRHVFIEEAAEFIPQRVIDGDVYAEVEKLARIGGNSRLGYTLINQRSQEVSKAVLELCENLFLHRQKGKNALDSLAKWFDLAEVAERKEIMKSLPNLPSGQCWAWMGGADEIPILIKVPAKNSHHPDRRAMRGDVAVLAKSAVDVGSFVSSMKVSLVEIEETDKANDPKLLRAEIARLTALTKAPTNVPQNIPADPNALQNAEARGYGRGWQECERQVRPQFEALKQLAGITVKNFCDSFQSNIRGEVLALDPSGAPVVSPTPAPTRAPVPAVARKPSPAASGDGTIQRREMKVLEAVARWKSIGFAQPSRVQVAFLSGYTPSGGGYRNILGALRAAGYLSYPNADAVALTETGEAASAHIGGFSKDDLVAGITQVLDPREKRVLDPIMEHFPKSVARGKVAEVTGYEPTGGGYRNILGKLRSVGLIQYPDADSVVAEAWLFP